MVVTFSLIHEDFRMFRSLTLFCFAAVFALSAAFAQDATEVVKIKATPEVLTLFDESMQSLSQAEPNFRVGGLFQLLGFAMNFENNAPAQKIVEAILALAPSIEPEELRYQLFGGVANAFCDMGKYPEAVAVVNRIPNTAPLHEHQLHLAIKIVSQHENDKTLQPFDTSALLSQAATGAAGAKNDLIETIALAFLGRELARLGKQEESVAAFAAATNAAKKLGEDMLGRALGMIFEKQVQSGQVASALATLQTISNSEAKLTAAQAIIEALMQLEKYSEAEALLKTFPLGDAKDNLLGSLVMAMIKNIADAKVGELASLMSSDESRERFLAVVARQLQVNGRSDVATLVSKRLNDPAVAERTLLIGKVESFLEEKKFVEAVQFIDATEKDEAIRPQLKRQILMMQYRETFDETIAGQIEGTFTGSEKVATVELRDEAKRAAAEASEPAKRFEALLEIFQEQSRYLDFVGARQTLALIAEQIDKGTEPAQLIQDRLLLARLQVEMRDKVGAKANLGKLMQTLSAVKNLSDFKDFVPTPPSALGVESAVDESAIRNQLFQVYFMSASLLAKADASAESQAAFAKAKELANAESNAAAKAEKLLVLAQFLTEEQKQ